jgi:hypothetical protein
MWFNIPCKLGKEADALGLKFALGRFGARAQQAVVRPRIVVGEGAMGLNKPNTHLQFPHLNGQQLRLRLMGKATTAGSKSASST